MNVANNIVTTQKPINDYDITDDSVVELVRQGKIEAYEIIMRRYNQRLFRTARSILCDDGAAQDAVQESYIAAYLRLPTYTAGSSFSAWLTRITINEALMIKRKASHRIGQLSDQLTEDSTLTSGYDPMHIHANRELAGLIETAIDALPDQFRTVFVLREVQQLSITETALSLDIPEATVKTRLHRARSIMQTNLNRHIKDVGLHAFEFAGQRCDQIVINVFRRLNGAGGAQRCPPRVGDFRWNDAGRYFERSYRAAASGAASIADASAKLKGIEKS